MDGAIFLVCEPLSRDVQQPRLSGPIRDHDLLELGLQESQADGNVIVVVAVEIGFIVYAEEAEVPEFEFDAVVGRGVAGTIGAICVAIVGFWGVEVRDGGGCGRRFWFCRVKMAVGEAVQVDSRVIAKKAGAVAWAGAVGGCVAVFGGRAAVLEAQEREKTVGEWATGDLVCTDCVVTDVFDAACGLIGRELVVRRNERGVVLSSPDFGVVALSSGRNDKGVRAIALTAFSNDVLQSQILDLPFHARMQCLLL